MIKGIPSSEDRVQAALIFCSTEAVQAACKMHLGPPVVMPGGDLLFRFHDGLSACEVIPSLSYCSCQHFERNGTNHTVLCLLHDLISNTCKNDALVSAFASPGPRIVIHNYL